MARNEHHANELLAATAAARSTGTVPAWQRPAPKRNSKPQQVSALARFFRI